MPLFDDTEFRKLPVGTKTKKCNKCRRVLPESCFSPSGGGTYLRPECKKCNVDLARTRQILKKKIKHPSSDYKCPICLRGEDEVKYIGGRAGAWVLDHVHETKEYRGFLCHMCNRALGNFNEEVERMKRAIEYLEGSNRNQC